MKEKLTNIDFEKKILNLLRKEMLSVSKIAKKLDIRRDVVAGYLEALKNQGKLEFHRVGRSNIYTIPRNRKMNKFIFFTLVILFLTINSLISATPILTSSGFFMDGVANFLGSSGCVHNWDLVYLVPAPIPHLPTPSTRSISAINLETFYNMQKYSFQKGF